VIRDAQTLVGGGDDGRQSCHGAAVVVDRLDGRMHGVAGGDGGRQDEDVLALDHRGEIVAEDDMAAAGVLGGDEVDGLVSIQVGKAVYGQLVVPDRRR